MNKITFPQVAKQTIYFNYCLFTKHMIKKTMLNYR